MISNCASLVISIKTGPGLPVLAIKNALDIISLISDAFVI